MKNQKVITNQFFIIPLIYINFLTLSHIQTIYQVLILRRFKIVWPLLPGNVSFPIFFKRIFTSFFCRMYFSQCFSIGGLQAIFASGRREQLLVIRFLRLAPPVSLFSSY